MKTPKTNIPSSRAAWDGYDMEGSRVRKRIANAQPLTNPEIIWGYQLDNHLGTGISTGVLAEEDKAKSR